MWNLTHFFDFELYSLGKKYGKKLLDRLAEYVGQSKLCHKL